ncbi:MAG: hypothetical protein IPJ41_18565 [Phycisphaerales bacterium]|nr:hypothetical protein [Phycisphaerales bacterium]
MISTTSTTHAPTPQPWNVDLRKRVLRSRADTLVERAALLSKEERLLVEGVFRDGRTVTQLARVWRRPEGPRIEAKSLQRRLRRILRRMHTPEFAFVAKHRGAWPPPMDRVATACILHGLTLREASLELGLSVHTVRRNFHAVLALCAAHVPGDSR